MARITLHIDADSPTDLADALSALQYITAYRSEPSDEPGAGARQDAEPGERQAVGTKFRRTQDEIARGLTVEQAKAERAGTVVAPTPASGASESQPSQSEATTTADPFAEPKTASPPTSDASTGTTLEQVKTAMAAYLNVESHDAMGLKAILGQFGAARYSELKEADYAAVLEALAA